MHSILTYSINKKQNVATSTLFSVPPGVAELSLALLIRAFLGLIGVKSPRKREKEARKENFILAMYELERRFYSPLKIERRKKKMNETRKKRRRGTGDGRNIPSVYASQGERSARRIILHVPAYPYYSLRASCVLLLLLLLRACRDCGMFCSILRSVSASQFPFCWDA